MDKIVIAMKIEQIKKIFEEDEGLKYALATNLAKYGRPQSKKSDKPSKLTKSLEKKREKNVKDLKKSMDEQDMGSPFPVPNFDSKGYIAARKLIDNLRATTFRKLNDDELEDFRKEIANAFDLQLKEDLSENFDKVSGGIPYKVENGNAIISIPLPDDAKERIIKRAEENGYSASPNMAGGVTIRKKGLNEDLATLEKISDMLDRKFPDLRFDVNTMSDRIDVRGFRSDVIDFGEELQGKKIFDYEVFYIEEDPGERGAIVRIVKSDSIMRGGVNEEQTMQNNPNLRMATYAGRPVVVNTMGTEDMTKWTATFLNTGKKVDFADVIANIKLDEKKKKKKDRCHRKADQVYGTKTSAYKSGAIVKCRKGMIWKKKK